MKRKILAIISAFLVPCVGVLSGCHSNKKSNPDSQQDSTSVTDTVSEETDSIDSSDVDSEDVDSEDTSDVSDFEADDNGLLDDTQQVSDDIWSTNPTTVNNETLPPVPGAEDPSFVPVPSGTRLIRVDAGKVVNPDYLGIGINIIPVSLMENNLSKGYNYQYWEMEKKRILMMRPNVARVWFQLDWFETAKGVYDWNTPKMQAFYQYLDVLKQAGTEIELDFSWKIGRTIQPWFCMPGVNPDVSAPRDLDDFAKSCSATLNELIQNRGYSNIKYLTFYNEPNGNWDFECLGNQAAYFALMLKTVSLRLTADGRRSLVHIWGPEESNAPDWFQYMKDNVDPYIDEYSFHCYIPNFATMVADLKTRLGIAESKPVMVTEYGEQHPSESWNTAGHAEMLISTANTGVRGALAWQMSGSYLEDPNETTCTGISGDPDAMTMWDALQGGGMKPSKGYYQYSLLSRYVPAHSQVLTTTVAGGDDVRSASFKTPDGNYTVVVECKPNETCKLDVEMSGAESGKVLYRHCISTDVVPEEDALIPVVSKTFESNSAWEDIAEKNRYELIVYTTMPPVTQVNLNQTAFIVKAGNSVQIDASIIDNDQGVNYSMASGVGSVSSSGLYTAPYDAKRGDMAAVKISSSKDPSAFAIALIAVR